jgi:cytochrome c553
VNGDSTDHRLENLVTLCIFCHQREGDTHAIETASRVHPDSPSGEKYEARKTTRKDDQTQALDRPAPRTGNLECQRTPRG